MSLDADLSDAAQTGQFALLRSPMNKHSAISAGWLPEPTFRENVGHDKANFYRALAPLQMCKDLGNDKPNGQATALFVPDLEWLI